MKKCLIVGNFNCVSSKFSFPLFKNNLLWISKYSKIHDFVLPDNSIKKFGNTCWLTNLKYLDTYLNLTVKYDSTNYYRYENYDAINIDKLLDIPIDFDGVMGVPVTILEKWDSRFEIVGLACGDLAKSIAGFVPMPVEIDRTMKGHSTVWVLYYKNDKGEYIRPYTRLLIKRRFDS